MIIMYKRELFAWIIVIVQCFMLRYYSLLRTTSTTTRVVEEGEPVSSLSLSQQPQPQMILEAATESATGMNDFDTSGNINPSLRSSSSSSSSLVSVGSTSTSPSNNNSNEINLDENGMPKSITKTFKDINSSNGQTFLQTFYTKSSKYGGWDALVGGNCWCTPRDDNFCTCTPSLAIDVILRADDNEHVWLIQRGDGTGIGKYATMGGFVEVGETCEEAVVRELYEETSIQLKHPPQLFGIYSDPKRDVNRHRHSVSIVYVVNIPHDQIPKAGDDAQNVIKVSLDDIDTKDFFIDHKTIFEDYRRFIQQQQQEQQHQQQGQEQILNVNGGDKDIDPATSTTTTTTTMEASSLSSSIYKEPFKRSVCQDGGGGALSKTFDIKMKNAAGGGGGSGGSTTTSHYDDIGYMPQIVI